MQSIKEFFLKIVNFIKPIFSKNNLLASQLISDNLRFIIIISGSLILIAIIVKALNYWKFKKHLIKQKIANIIYTWLITVSLISLFLTFCAWQQIGFFAYLFWWYLLILTFLCWGFIIFIYRIKKYPLEINEYEDYKRKEKYLPKRKK